MHVTGCREGGEGGANGEMNPLQEVIEAPPEFIGHVIGEGGSTIKCLQCETGATITISDGCRVCITADNKEKLSDATSRVRDIINAAINPDYEGPEGSRLRKDAAAWATKRAELLDEVTRLRGEGKKHEVSLTLEEAKKAGEQMRLKNQEAANAIARHNNENKGKGKDYFDMHGLRVEEAVNMLKSRVERLREASVGEVAEMQIITGAGRHSGPEGAKLKKAVADFLRESNIEFVEVSTAELRAKIVGICRPVKETKVKKATCNCF
ncbi:hypothetical protein, conserved [Trypanosoma brucei gambiense DAL972]|uniref:Smr domain-containing protein n=2 Tax=Trypanosoma brucei TaxID=5691 RepID=C9ZMG4_TRYB9|nr:hypothetical protein, conserved [Trypanosoma brucei gambiense DAL972]RHW73191.1 KH domain/(DUF1771)/Smr domain containing protein [Trypanosoma brucei equiperdum]CBH10838.1 hypothetical protein, conserved [Trypanosoma brucei gambiense DAL972]|eukprot:XP_011773125.1 hypothetical protein, conserved [Trypanosoma brucei gambiense DAL972]